MTNLGKSICQLGGDEIAHGCSWAWFVFFVQIPFIYWYAKGGPAIHPIVIMLPLIMWLNFKAGKMGVEGIGIRLVQPGHSLLLAFIFSTLSATGWWISLHMNSVSIKTPLFTLEMIWGLVESFLIFVFIIALWEQFVNRGFTQTRLQASWGFGGVMVTTLLLAAVHIPSTLLNSGNNMQWIVVRFLETVLVGFVLGYACWRTGRLLMSVTIHGLNNFTPSVFSTKTGLSYQRSAFNQPCFQLAGLTGQVGVTACHCHIFFENTARQTGDR